MNRIILAFAVASLVCLTQRGVVHAQTLLPSRVVYTSDAADRDAPIVPDTMNPGALADNGADMVVRERRFLDEDTIQIRSFLDFDLSSLTPADVNDPTFTAMFSIDYVNQLNNVNSGVGLEIGRVLDDGVNGDSWEETPGNYPDYTWGRPNAADSAVIIEDMIEPDPTVPPTTSSTFVTDIVRDWVNGVHANNGFVLSGTIDWPQGGGFANAELNFDLVLGDFDLNDVVNEADFMILNDNLAGELDGLVEYTDGDIDFDGDVDLDDFGTFKGAFPGVVASALGVPEPHTVGLLAIASGLLLTSARSRRPRR